MRRIVYWLTTGLMFLLMSFSIIGYHLNYEQMAGFFIKYGYPTYIVLPLAYLKLCALLAIASNRYRNLKDIAYGAYFINMVAATAAHVLAGETPVHAYIGLIVVPVSYMLSNSVRGEPRYDAFLLK